MPSGEVRKFSLDCKATVGQVGNLDHENETYGKAGRTRWRGNKPTVRGVAMNPVDHPHGGGEGRVKGNHPQTPWAFPTLGQEDARQQAHRPHDRRSGGSKTKFSVAGFCSSFLNVEGQQQKLGRRGAILNESAQGRREQPQIPGR